MVDNSEPVSPMLTVQTQRPKPIGFPTAGSAQLLRFPADFDKTSTRNPACLVLVARIAGLAFAVRSQHAAFTSFGARDRRDRHRAIRIAMGNG